MPERTKQKEHIQPISYEWLAGMFEVGGAMYFTVSYSTQKGVQYPHAYPVMQIGERDIDKLTKFKSLVGGNFKKGNSNSSPMYWYLQGVKAVPLAEGMAPFAPSRQEIILAYLLWEDAESMDEKIEIAQNSRQEKSPLNLQVSDYTSLVKNPDFVAGVIDMRGSFYTNEAFNNTATEDVYGWSFPRLSISTTNRLLLEAMQQEYGGSIEEVILKGTKQKRGRIEFTAAQDSLRWRTGHEGHDKIIQLVNQRLKLLSKEEK